MLISYPYAADNHQEINARDLVAVGAALLFTQSELIPERLAAVLRPLLIDPSYRTEMGARMKALARPRAAATVIDWCEAMKVNNMTAIVHEFPGPATRFWRTVPIERHHDVLTLIDDVFMVLRTFVRPLVVEVTQVVMDSALGLPRPRIALDAASVAIVYESK